MNKIALITGGTSGIGLKTAEILFTKGYLPIIIGSTEESVQKASSSLDKKGVRHEAHACDIREEKNICSLMDLIKKSHPVIDCLIHGAGGLGGRLPAAEMTGAFYRNVMALNLDSFVFFVRECLPCLEKSKNFPSIVAFTSIAAYDGGGPGVSIYAAAKGALVSMGRNMAKEFISKGIRVNLISPGVIETPFHSATKPELLETFKKNIPMGRFGTGEEVAKAAAFLVSEDAAYIVGEVLHINGGQRMQ